MASPSKSSRNRRLPSPRIKEMSTKDDDSFSKYIKESSQNGDSGAFDENGKLLISDNECRPNFVMSSN